MTNQLFDIDLLFSPVIIVCAVLLLLGMIARLIVRRKQLSTAQRALAVFGLVLSLAYLLFLVYLVFAFDSSRPDPQPVSTAALVFKLF